MATQAITKPETKNLETAIETLRKEVQSLKVVTTAQEYERLGQVLVSLNNYAKDVHSALDPFVEIPRRAYEAARQERQKWLNAAEELKALASTPLADYKRRERLAAEAEQNRINEERRRAAEAQAAIDRKAAEAQAEEDRKKRQKEIDAAKKSGDIGKREADRLKKEAEAEAARAKVAAAEEAKKQAENVQTVTVQPSVPKVGGLRGRVNYYAEVVNPDLILSSWADTKDPERKAFLRKFITIDEQAIGKEARERKNSDAMNALIPGINAFDKDSI